jgi:hypothetical protein
MSSEVTKISMLDNRSGARANPSLREALGFWWKLGWIGFGGTAAQELLLVLASPGLEMSGSGAFFFWQQFGHSASRLLYWTSSERTQAAVRHVLQVLALPVQTFAKKQERSA